jgi:hypothetical protein
MRIVVDEMTKEPWECPWCSDELCTGDDDDEYVCTYENSKCYCRDTSHCPFFVGFKDMFKNEIDW